MDINNYVNKYSVYGLMNNTCSFPDENNIFGFWKTKNHKKYVSFDKKIPNDKSIEKVSMMYLDELNDTEDTKEYWDNKGYVMSKPFKEEEIYSCIEKNDIIDIARSDNRELYETCKKYNKLLDVIKITDTSLLVSNGKVYTDFSTIYDDIINMIKKWALTSGKKYGFRRHDGIDKSFFTRVKNKTIDINDYNIYVFKYGDEIVGYSVIEKNSISSDNNFVYLIRKCLRYTEDERSLRNLCMYIDWYTFAEQLRYNNMNNIIINWGCSSGGVAEYKKTKWKLDHVKNLYFYSLSKK